VGGTQEAPTLTLDLPVPADFGDHGDVRIEQSQLPTQINGGIENLTLDVQGAPVALSIGHNVMNGWASNVRIQNHGNYGIYVENSTRVTVRGCFIDPGGAGSNHSGILVNTVYGGLFENNIVDRNAPGLEVNHSTAATAFVNNLFFGNALGMDVNHGPHNYLNLYENNVTSTFMPDGYFGGASHDLVNRNWFLGVVNTTFDPATGLPNDGAASFMAALKRGTRHYFFVNNVCGTPGYTAEPVGDSCINVEGQPYMGNGSGTGTASLLQNDPWFDWDATASPPGPKSWTATYKNRLDTDGDGKFETGVVELDPKSATDFAERIALFGNLGFRGFPNGGTVQNGAVTGASGTVGYPVSLKGQELTFTLANEAEVTPAAGLEGISITLDPGAEGFAEFDLDVAATTTSRGNGDIYGKPVRDAFKSGESASASYMDGGSDGVDYMAGYSLIDPAKPPKSIAVIPAGAHYLEYAAQGRFEPDD